MPDFIRDIVSFFSANVTENTFIAVGTTISAVCSAYLVFVGRAASKPHLKRDGGNYKLVNNFQHPIILRNIVIIGGTFYESGEYIPGDGYEDVPTGQSVEPENRTVYFGESLHIGGRVCVDGKRFETTATVSKVAFRIRTYDVILTPSNPA